MRWFKSSQEEIFAVSPHGLAETGEGEEDWRRVLLASGSEVVERRQRFRLPAMLR